MNQFNNIDYLKQGNEKQKAAHQVLKEIKIFELLYEYHPILVGTIPIEIDIPDSDLDIICEVYDLDNFDRMIKDKFGMLEDFKSIRQMTNSLETSVITFIYKRFVIEIFGQPRPVYKQNGYCHMKIEKRLLDLGGKKAKRDIIRIKRAGLKTEPAFAKYFHLEGDPYKELLKLYSLSEEQLKRVIKLRVSFDL